MNEQEINRMSYQEAAATPLGHVEAPEALGPNAYGVICRGDCLAPVINDGDTVICDPDAEPASGDYVNVWWKGADSGPSVKRLAFALPPRSLWGALDDSDDLEGMLFCDQHNPSLRLSAPFAQIEAVHKVVQTRPASEGDDHE